MNTSTSRSQTVAESSHVVAAPNLRALLRYQDKAFIDCAYLTLLRRPADPAGFDHYLRSLRGGTPKIQIVDEISRSIEGRSRNVQLPGLRNAVRDHNLVRRPVIGRLFRLFFNAEGTSANDRRIRIVEQQIFALQSDVQQLQQLTTEPGTIRHTLPARGTSQSVLGSPSPDSRPHGRRTDQGFINNQRTIYYYIDHTVQCQTNTGMQRVARCLARALLAAGERILFVKWDSDQNDLVLVSRDDLEHFSKWNGPSLSLAEKAIYPMAGAAGMNVPTHALAEECWLVVPEVTYITFHSAPVTLDLLAESRRNGLRSMFVYYDAIPLRRPEHAGAAAQHENYTQQVLLADLVVPISRWVATDLVSFFREHDHASLSPTPKVVPVLLPGESQCGPRITRAPLISECDHLILSVGTLEARKNQTVLVRAFETFCARNPATDWQLFLVGNLHPSVASEIMGATERNPRIQYLSHVADEDLDALYRRCAFTAFPSVEEGFGLPILESMWYAKPCVCADFGAMAEVAAGGGCVTVDTRYEGDVLEAMESLINSPDRIERLSRDAVARRLRQWTDYAASLAKEMELIVSPIRGLGAVYYWIDHTCTYPVNSGIQRVVRGLARALIELGIELIPVKWNSESRKMMEVSSVELQHLAKWNGPPIAHWAAWREPQGTNGWLLVPELTTYLPQPDIPGLRELLVSVGLRSAWIFHDAIPWKMRDSYPPEAVGRHQTYMLYLNRQELVLPTSNFTYMDLLDYLGRRPERTPSLFERVVPCRLPGEFAENPRVLHVKESDGPTVKILSVGTVEPRKNHLVLLQAFKRLQSITAIPVELVIAGGAPFSELADKIQEIIASEQGIRWLLSPSDRELSNLYEQCDFTVYSSPEEGFGLPIVESLWHARPCVCASFGAMQEVAEGGGCMTTDVRDPSQLAQAMLRLVVNKDLRRELAVQAATRSFRTWREYATDVASRMASERMIPLQQDLPPTLNHKRLYREFVNLRPRPKLSVCITTYNRAGWLAISLRNLTRLWPTPSSDVEFVVCDNASTDHTPDIAARYLTRSDMRYIRNPENVGMLGNLRVTANQARGEYIWILGDDDLVCPGGIERVLDAIRRRVEVGLVYLNYSYTRLADAGAVTDLDAFLAESTPIVAPSPDRKGSIRELCAMSENFFTAIYCLVFRRDHALRAYTQNTDGRPFSTLLTCIPTTYYVLNFMMDDAACWIGTPTVVVNMNVSWMKYAPLWILERIPEVYDLAERFGADRGGIDRWRRHNLPGVVHFLKEMFENDSVGNAEYFSMRRLLSRLKGLNGVDEYVEPMRSIYVAANLSGHPAARDDVDGLFAGFRAPSDEAEQ